MNRLLVGLLLTSLVMSLMPGTVRADLPTFNFSDVSAYKDALRTSKDPYARAILAEILNGPADLAAARALAAKDGIHLVDDYRSPPDDQNAAPLYVKWYITQKAKGIDLPIWAQPLTLKTAYTAKQITLVQQIVYENSDSDAYLMQAITKPVFYMEPTDPAFAFPAYARLRGAAREITTKSTLLALSGNPQDAAIMQANGLVIASQMAQQKSLISYLVAVAIDAITLDGEQNILTHNLPNAALSASVTSSVTHSLGAVSLQSGLSGEMAYSLQMFQQTCNQILATQLPSAGAASSNSANTIFAVELIDAGEARALNDLRRSYELAGEPSMQRRVDLAANDRREDSIEAVANDPIAQTFGQTMDYGKVAEKDDEIIAREEVLLAGAAVLSAKATTGLYPASLPGTFTDPFSGNQLLYEQTAQGFEVYSVGPSGKFDGNLIPGKTGAESTFVYPAPPPTPIPADELVN